MENKLPVEFKEKLVIALRSGQFKQGRSKLYNSNTDSYCCLGVVGVVAGVNKMEMDTKGYFSCYTGEVPEKYPTFLTSGHGDLIEVRNAEYRYLDDVLMVMNDVGKSFSEIADYIEKNL
jgi:hypothetical protein